MIPLPLNVYVTAILAILLSVFVYVAADVMGLFPSRNRFDVEGKTVVLTGGSQGMGRGLAKLLAQKGANVVIVARDKAKLQKAVEYISAAAKSPSQRFHYISADMTIASESTRILAEVTSWNNDQPPDIVWANAGSAHPGLFAETSIETLRSQMDINYWAAAYLSHAALNLFLKPTSASPSTSTATSPATAPQPKHIIMTSSVLAFTGLAGYSPYCPAKAAMRNLADALRSEVHYYNGARRSAVTSPSPPPADIAIHIVLPGTILSPGFDNEEKLKHPVTKILEEGDPRQSEDEVAAAAVRGLEKGKFMVTTQFLGAAMRGAMIGVSPRENVVVDTLMAWVTAVAWLFIGPDLDGKVWGYGKKNGLARK